MTSTPPNPQLLHPTDVRAFAVAKLKRAASLPRMKDGRRPPMHGEAVSEGERATPSPNEEEITTSTIAAVGAADEDEEDETPHAHQQSFARQPEPDPGPEPEAEPEPEPEPEPEGQQSESASAPSRTTTPTAAKRKKRRSRSRSRTRSKDLQARLAAASAADSEDDFHPAQLLQQQLQYPIQPPFPLQYHTPHQAPPVPISPFLAGITNSPRVLAAAAAAATSPTSPFVPAPSPLPSLDAIRAGLARSNSAAGRMMAFHKLTGGTESPEPMRLSPSPALTRSNTVTGGERVAARMNMLKRLGERKMKESEGISEEQQADPMQLQQDLSAPNTPRRRPLPGDIFASAGGFSGHGSPNGRLLRSPLPQPSTKVVDDREVSETSPNSPIMRGNQYDDDDEDEDDEDEGDEQLSTPVPENVIPRFGSAFGAIHGMDTAPSTGTLSHGPFEYDTAEVREDGVVIERDEPPTPSVASSATTSRMFPTSRPPTKYPISPTTPPQRPRVLKTRPSLVTTESSMSTSTAEPVPFLLPAQGEPSPYKQDTFPVAISPYGTPMKESIIAAESDLDGGEEGEEVVYPPNDVGTARKLWGAKGINANFASTSSWVPLTAAPSEEEEEDEFNEADEVEEEPEDEDDDDDVPLAIRLQQTHSQAGLLEPRATKTFGPNSSPEGSSPGNTLQLPSTRTSRASAESSATPPGAAASRSDEGEDTSPPPPLERTNTATSGTSAKTQTQASKPVKESPWQKVRAFARSGSSMGLNAAVRSRSNSFGKEGSPPVNNRESGASSNTAPSMNLAASSSMVSLSQARASPVPPASAADLARYADHSKLMPFPGLAKLQEERTQGGVSVPGLERRPSKNNKGSPPRPGTANTTLTTTTIGSEGASTLSRSNSARERPMSPASSKLLGSSTGSSNTITNGSGGNKDGVRKWLSKKWLTQQDSTNGGGASSSSSGTPVVEIVPPGTAMKPPVQRDEEVASPTPQASVTRENAAKLEQRRQANVLAKLDTILEHAQRDPVRKSALNEPPRKLLLVSKVFQVLDRETIKDRYLFLFTDILVIAKPVNTDREKAALDRSFAVKSIVEISKIDFDPLRDGEGSSAGGGFNKHPSVRQFVQEFAKDPEYAITSFLQQMKLKDDHMTIANLLFRTTELDKTQLGLFLSRRGNKNVLKSFVDRFGFTGMRIDYALRTFLLALRLPRDPTLLEYLLSQFSHRWFEANKTTVAYDKEVSTRLVFAMMQLNDALHYELDNEMTPAGGVFSFPNRSLEAGDFVEAFRVMDRQMLVTDDVLGKIFHSIRNQKLSQALDASVQPIVAWVSEIGSRLTTKQLSDYITIRIPKPDPHFGIQLHGQGLLFEPNVLSFAHSNEASFRVVGNHPGAKTAIFVRTGANASLYTGIPFSKVFNVERPFMRHVFRIAFTNHMGMPRKYLYSVENKLEHANWTNLIQKQLAAKKDAVTPVPPSPASFGTVSPGVRRAAEAVALRVLRDALIIPDEKAPGTANTATRVQPKPISPGYGSTAPAFGTDEASAPLSRATNKTGSELVVICQQNSLIPLVLSFLNVVKPI